MFQLREFSLKKLVPISTMVSLNLRITNKMHEVHITEGLVVDTKHLPEEFSSPLRQ